MKPRPALLRPAFVRETVYFKGDEVGSTSGLEDSHVAPRESVAEMIVDAACRL